ncbi:MAG: hypothetical protein ACTSYU_01290 [Promethearchaeota archaeon]
MRIDNTNESNESNQSEKSEKLDGQYQNSQTQSPNKETSSNLPSFKQMEDYGILYLEKQKKYLIFSAIFPVFSIIIQIFNIFFIMGQFMVRNAPMGHMSSGRPFLFDLLSPSFIFILLSLIALVKFIILKQWENLIKIYQSNSSIPTKITSEKIHSEIDNNQSISEKGIVTQRVSLAGLFYEIVETMIRLRKVFIIFNIVFLFSFQWVTRFILMVVKVTADPYSKDILFFNIINPIGELSMIIYLIIEWRQFLQWNKKLVKLENFEKRVYSELGEGEL